MTSEIVSKEDQHMDIKQMCFETYQLRISNMNIHSVHNRKDYTKDPSYHLLSPFDFGLTLSVRRVPVLEVPNVVYVYCSFRH